MIIIVAIMGKIYLSILGIEFPKKYPLKIIENVHKKPPNTLEKIKLLYFIFPTPAKIGTKVLTIGTKRAKIMVFLPY